jgi:hypothetical protein
MSSQQPQSLQIDHEHCRAICDEIGERLRLIFKPEAAELPERLSRLLQRLAEMEHEPAPSIVPSMGDMVSWPTANATQ